MWNDLKKFKDQDINPDFIFISGDIAYSGNSDEYVRAEKFLDKLLDVTGKSKDNLFLVPGNHDVDRDKITKHVRKLCQFNNRDEFRSVLEEDDCRNMIMMRFKNYFNFVNQYFSDCPKQIIQDSDHYYFTKIIEIRSYHISILGLNSCWTSGTNLLNNEVHDNGSLIVGEKQVTDAIHKSEYNKNINLRIAVW